MRVVSILLLTEVLCVLCVYYLPGTVSPIPYLHLSLCLICRPAYLEMPTGNKMGVSGHPWGMTSGSILSKMSLSLTLTPGNHHGNKK